MYVHITCTGELKHRELDDQDIILVRLKEYSVKTLPITSFISAQGVVVNEVDGEGTIDEVAERVNAALVQQTKPEPKPDQ